MAQLSEGANAPENSSERKIKTLGELNACPKMTCVSPERDLIVYPKWICFQSESLYTTPQFAKFCIENRDSSPIAFNIKAREKIFRVEWGSGILAAGEMRVIKLFLITSDDWALSIPEYTQKKLKVAIESLRIPEDIQPASLKDSTLMAKCIWKRAYNEWPLERLYTKINIALTSVVPTIQAPSSTVTTKFTV